MSAYLPTFAGCTQRLGQLKSSYIDPYVPSKDACFAKATQTVQTVASYFPQKGGAAAVVRLGQQIQALQTPENQSTVTAATRLEVQQQKGALIRQYETICGTYFEDPSSQIHLAWSNFILEERVYNESASQPFDRSRPGDTDASLPVSQAFQRFLDLDQQARNTMQQIDLLGSTIQSDPELLAALREEKRVVKERDDALCSTEIPRAKREYEASLSDSSDHITIAALLDIHKAFEKQHAQNVRTLSLFDQMLSAADVPDSRMDAIVAQKIQVAVQGVQRRIAAQQSNVGIDWTRTGVHVMSGIVIPVTAMLLAPSTVDPSTGGM